MEGREDELERDPEPEREERDTDEYGPEECEADECDAEEMMDPDREADTLDALEDDKEPNREAETEVEL